MTKEYELIVNKRFDKNQIEKQMKCLLWIFSAIFNFVRFKKVNSGNNSRAVPEKSVHFRSSPLVFL